MDQALNTTVRLLDALNCGALLIDRSGRIDHANKRLCEMMQLSADQIIGRKVIDFYPTDEGKNFIAQRLAAFDQAHEGEFFLPRPDGSQLPVIISSRPLGPTPPLSEHRLITAIDVAGQKKAEQRLQEEYSEIAKLSDTVLEQALALKRYNQTLEDRVRERTIDLHDANMDSIYMLAVASEAKDQDTGAHVRRIERYTRLLAEELGLANAEADRIGFSAILHDVGKMLVPDQILKKPGPLERDERGQMQLHAIAGERILSSKPFFETARRIARSHHENWDGSGYPDGLAGEAIPLPARIVHLADVFDALTSQRVYKPPWPAPRAVQTIVAESGKAFDPKIVSAFESLIKQGKFDPPAVEAAAVDSK
jgi:PAS domain S-box-containing protein